MNITPFQKLVYSACRKIPKGRVSTYQEIARVIGKPKSYRAVGNALNVNPYAPQVPCHRVVKTDGSIGGFASGCGNKIRLLKKERIKIKSNKVVNFSKVFFKMQG